MLTEFTIFPAALKNEITRIHKEFANLLESTADTSADYTKLTKYITDQLIIGIKLTVNDFIRYIAFIKKTVKKQHKATKGPEAQRKLEREHNIHHVCNFYEQNFEEISSN